MRVKVSEGKTKDVAIIDVTPEITLSRTMRNICIIALSKLRNSIAKRANGYQSHVFRNSAKKAMKTALPSI